MCRSFLPPAEPRSDRFGAVDALDRRRQLLAHHLSLLLDVVRAGRWPSFEAIALSRPGVFRLIDGAIPSVAAPPGDGGTLLHACLRHDPPAKVVARMIELHADAGAALRARDGRGRTPLHVAAARGADDAVVELLSSSDPAACAMRDDDGRTPLHLACDASDDPRRGAPSRGAVRALLSSSLAASLAEDDDGRSALECAVLSGASIDVVALLQKAMAESHQKGEAPAGANDTPWARESSKRRRTPDG